MTNKNQKIMLIEDEKDLADVFALKFRSEGLEPIIINDGAAALAAIIREKPALVLLDLMIPEVDGFSILASINKEKINPKPLIYVWSNLTQKKDMDLVGKMNINGYLIKSDYTPSALAKKIKDILAKKS